MSVLSKELQYTLKPALPKLKTYTQAFVSNSLQYSEATSCRLDIPYLKNAFIDCGSSFLRFTVNASHTSTSGIDTYIDFSALSLINAWQVYSQGQSVLLEDIQNANVLWCALTDLLASPVTTATSLSTITSTNDDLTAPRLGYKFTGLTTTAQSATFACPIPSGVLGFLNAKHLPASGFTTMIQWESAANALTTASGTASYTVSNVELVLNIIEMPEELFQMVVASTGSPSLSIATTHTVPHHTSIPQIRRVIHVLSPMPDLAF